MVIIDDTWEAQSEGWKYLHLLLLFFKLLLPSMNPLSGCPKLCFLTECMHDAWD